MVMSPARAWTLIQLEAASRSPSCSRNRPAQTPCSRTASAVSPSNTLNSTLRVAGWTAVAAVADFCGHRDFLRLIGEKAWKPNVIAG